MIFNNIRLRYYFAIKKSVGQPGIIVDQYYFRNDSLSDKMKNWWKNYQTLGDMQRSLSDFNRKKSLGNFLNYNNQLIHVIQKRNLRDLQVMVNQNIFKQLKNLVKNNEPISNSLNLFEATQVKIVQARSYMDNIIRLKSIDQWYQVTLEYQNIKNTKKSYHVMQRFYKQKKWKFIKLNM